MLRHRFGKVAAWRRDRAYHRDRAGLPALCFHLAGAFIEAGQPCRQVRRKALVGGHLLEASRQFAQRLGPARGGVSHDGHVIAHIAIVFRQGNAGIDTHFTSGHRHIRGIGDQYGALHQGASSARVYQVGEFPQHLGHFIAALAAAYIDNDLRLGPFCQGLLRHRLAGAEAAWYGGGAAFGDREEGIDDPQAGEQRLGQGQALAHRSGTPHRPVMKHGQGQFAAVILAQKPDLFLAAIFPGRGQLD